MNQHVVSLREQVGGYAKLVFDLDGTLYDTRDFERPALAGVANWLRSRSGLPLPDLERRLWERRESDRHRPGLFDSVLGEYALPIEWGLDCVRVFHDYPGEELKRAPSLREFLIECRERNCRLALVTNGRVELQRRKLELLDLRESFDVAVYCDPRQPHELKPSRWAWDRLEYWIDNEPVAYVGDDPVDAEFARAGGVPFVRFCFRSSMHDN